MLSVKEISGSPVVRNCASKDAQNLPNYRNRAKPSPQVRTKNQLYKASSRTPLTSELIQSALHCGFYLRHFFFRGDEPFLLRVFKTYTISVFSITAASHLGEDPLAHA